MAVIISMGLINGVFSNFCLHHPSQRLIFKPLSFKCALCGLSQTCYMKCNSTMWWEWGFKCVMEIHKARHLPEPWLWLLWSWMTFKCSRNSSYFKGWWDPITLFQTIKEEEVIPAEPGVMGEEMQASKTMSSFISFLPNLGVNLRNNIFKICHFYSDGV